MTRTAAQVKAELKELRAKYEGIIAQNDPSHDEELRETDARIEALLAEYSARSQDEQRAASNRQAMEQIFGGGEAPTSTTDGDLSRRDRNLDHSSLGARIVNDPEFKAWHLAKTKGGNQPFSANERLTSPTVSFDGVSPLGGLVTGLSSTSAGALVVEERLGGITPLERDEIGILDLLTRIPIDSDAYEFVRVTTETNNAAPVAESTDGTDGLKPTSEVALAVVSGVVETIAHTVEITRRAAADARQIMAYIDNFGRWGLQDELANQVITGDGTTPDLVGLENTSNTQSQAYDTSLLVTTRKARTLVRTVGKANPTAYLMDPADWESIDLLADNENRYYFGGPMRLGTPVLWGLPVVEEYRLTAGTAWVADWRQGLLFDREQTNVYMTDSHEDYFKRNILVLLFEMRAAFGVRRPKAFVEIDLTP